MKIKAVLWDIYGTLLIPKIGDLQQSLDKKEQYILSFKKFLKLLNDDFNIKVNISPEEGAEYLLNLIHIEHNVKKLKNITYPEVDIIKIWQLWFFYFTNKLFARRTIKKFSICFESINNPTTIAKNAVKVLTWIKKQKLKQGIISNAQFYTKIFLNKYINFNKIFDQELVFFSYQLGYAKPESKIYMKAIENLAKQNINPEESIYIGNDLQNDIYTPQKLKFNTILVDYNNTIKTNLENNSQQFKIIDNLNKIIEIINK